MVVVAAVAVAAVVAVVVVVVVAAVAAPPTLGTAPGRSSRSARLWVNPNLTTALGLTLHPNPNPSPNPNLRHCSGPQQPLGEDSVVGQQEEPVGVLTTRGEGQHEEEAAVSWQARRCEGACPRTRLGPLSGRLTSEIGP